MTIAFLAVFVVYLLHALVVNYRAQAEAPRVRDRLTLALQSPLFLFALYLGFHQGIVSRDLVSPLHIMAGLLLGHALFGLSLLVTHQELHDAAAHMLDFGALWRFLVESPGIIFRFLLVSATEEIIYRVAAQPLLWRLTESATAAIVLVALAFSAVHWHFFRNPVVQSAEFLGFALLLGLLYHATGSLSLVITVHTVRNLEIVYLEYLVRLDEVGDEGEALRQIEALYVHRSVERT